MSKKAKIILKIISFLLFIFIGSFISVHIPTTDVGIIALALIGTHLLTDHLGDHNENNKS